ncbi:MAG: YqgE/AlgH family protein [Rhodospirillales bacterium]
MARQEEQEEGYLTGQILIAMPSMSDNRFRQSVVYICAHNEDGAMGLVVNKRIDSLSFDELLQQLGIENPKPGQAIDVHFGGPVESGRGFVLHSAEYEQESTLQVDGRIAMTATLDILRDIATGEGPRQHLFALGYAGWGPGQLDSELQANGWLTAEANEGLIFSADLGTKWDEAIKTLGIDPHFLVSDAGHA